VAVDATAADGPDGLTPVGAAAGAALAVGSVADGSPADGSPDGEPVPVADGQPAGAVVFDVDCTGDDEPDGDEDPVAGRPDVLDPDDPDGPAALDAGALDVGTGGPAGHMAVPLPAGEAEVDTDLDGDVLGAALGPGVGFSAGGRPGFTGGAVGGGIGPGSLGSTGTVSPGTPRAYTASSDRTVSRYASEWL